MGGVEEQDRSVGKKSPAFWANQRRDTKEGVRQSMVRDQITWDSEAFKRESEVPRKVAKPSNIECVAVRQGEWDFWEGARLKKGEEWGEVRHLNEDASAS